MKFPDIDIKIREGETIDEWYARMKDAYVSDLCELVQSGEKLDFSNYASTEQVAEIINKELRGQAVRVRIDRDGRLSITTIKPRRRKVRGWRGKAKRGNA